MKKIAVLLTILSLTAVTGLSAQNYNWAIGVRGGVTASGITVRHNFDPVNSIEGMLDFAQGFNVYALYERNVPVIASGFNFYYGAGGNIGAVVLHVCIFSFGIYWIFGLEFKVASIPLECSLDFIPNLNVIG